MKKIILLAFSGSLRKASYNTAAIKALKQLAPSHVEITLGNIGDIPLFNPDRENEAIEAVDQLKFSLRNAQGLIISSPEYAHGISGPLKNALDWLVSDEEFPLLPIMLINTSPRASHALEALKEVLRTMPGNIIEVSYVSISLLGSELDVDGIVANTELVTALKQGLGEFCHEIQEKNL